MRFIYCLLRGVVRAVWHGLVLTFKLLGVLFLLGIGPLGWLIIAVMVVMDK